LIAVYVTHLWLVAFTRSFGYVTFTVCYALPRLRAGYAFHTFAFGSLRGYAVPFFAFAFYVWFLHTFTRYRSLRLVTATFVTYVRLFTLFGYTTVVTLLRCYYHHTVTVGWLRYVDFGCSRLLI